jgi:hypothetical protein
MDAKTALSVLNNELASTGETIKMPSSGVELAFRPITLSEQKKLSKLFLPTQTGKFSDIYNISVALIQQSCLTPDKLDFTQLTEIDRAVIILNFLSRNYTIPPIEIPCDNIIGGQSLDRCTGKIKLEMEYETIYNKITALDNIGTLSPTVKVFELGDKKIEFTIFYPNITLMQEFEARLEKEPDLDLIEAMKENKIEGIQARVAQIIANPFFAMAFIKKIRILEKTTDTEKYHIDLTRASLQDLISVVEGLPLHLFTCKGGINEIIQEKFIISLISNTSVDLVCPKCGKEHKNVISFYAFFI